MINLEQLHEFCTVVRFKNITKAADYLFVSQPSLSRHLSELESTLGVRLIERGASKAFTLTAAGEMLFREGERLLSDIVSTENHIKRLDSGNSGNLRLVSRLYMNAPWNRTLYSFTKEHPNIELQYFESPGEPLINCILSGHADLTVAYDYEIYQHKDQIEATLLWEEEFVAVVSPFSPLAELSSVTVERLKQEPLILGKTPEVGVYDKGPLNDVLSIFSANSYAALNNPSMALQTALDKGFSIFPQSIATTYPMLKILPFAALSCPIKCFLASGKDNTNPSIPLFVDYVKTHYMPSAAQFG